MWPWHRLAATALIRPLAWESPYSAGVALGKDKKKCGKTRKISTNYLSKKKWVHLPELFHVFLSEFYK